MTLDIKKLLKNQLKKQMTIQHFEIKSDIFLPKSIPSKIKDKIAEEFGDQFLLDAKYIAFFKGRVAKTDIKKLFNLVNKAFGEDANRLTEGDFKRITFGKPAEPEKELEKEPEKKEDSKSDDSGESDDSVESNDSEESDDSEENEESGIEEEPKKSSEDKKTIDTDEIVDEEPEKQESEKLDEDTKIKPTPDAYVFLKITTK